MKHNSSRLKDGKCRRKDGNSAIDLLYQKHLYCSVEKPLFESDPEILKASETLVIQHLLHIFADSYSYSLLFTPAVYTIVSILSLKIPRIYFLMLNYYFLLSFCIRSCHGAPHFPWKTIKWLWCQVPFPVDIFACLRRPPGSCMLSVT